MVILNYLDIFLLKIIKIDAKLSIREKKKNYVVLYLRYQAMIKPKLNITNYRDQIKNYTRCL